MFTPGHYDAEADFRATGSVLCGPRERARRNSQEHTMTINTRTADERRKLRDRFRVVLLDAAKQRGQREQIVQSSDGLFEAAWAEYERGQLLLSVNAERSRRGLPAATSDDIRHADRQAAGHVDYADKIALYCAEIAMGLERTVY